MPSSFQTCLLVSALAYYANAQSYLNLVDQPVVPGPAAIPQKAEEHVSPRVLDHGHDTDHQDRYLLEEEQLLSEHKHFQEVHHPHEAVDYGSREDVHRHRYYPSEDEHHGYIPHGHHEERQYDYAHEHDYSNEMRRRPIANESSPMDNVLEDADPAICFVKAYARKPLVDTPT